MADNDKDLFDRIATGDHDAYKALLERYRGNLFGQAMAYLKDVYKAQDVVQDVFLTIWHNRATLIVVESPEKYLHVIARNKIISEFRKKSLLPVPETLQPLSEDITPERKLEFKEMAALIQSAVDQMPPQRKMVFEMGKKQGLKYEEIAARLKISPNTVKTHMVQALSFIRGILRSGVKIFF